MSSSPPAGSGGVRLRDGPLVVSGCMMMRVCLDTCPVGIATQNPSCAPGFRQAEFVETFFEYIAEEVREHLAALGFRSNRRRQNRVHRHRH